jgi:Ca2+-binding EF-hand superfamily protein
LKTSGQSLPYLCGGQEVDMMAFLDILISKLSILNNENLTKMLKVFKISDVNANISVDEFLAVLDRHQEKANFQRSQSKIVLDDGMRERVEEIMGNLRAKFKDKPYTFYSKLFSRIDKSEGGSIEFNEFWDFIRYFEKSVDKQEARAIYERMDTSGNGDVSLDEFTEFFGFPKKLNRDNSVLLDIQAVLGDGQWGPILSGIHRNLINIRQTPESVFALSTNSAMKKTDFAQLLLSIKVSEQEYPNLQDFISMLENRKNVQYVDLDKFKAMLDEYFQKHMSELTSQMDSNYEGIYYSLLTAYDNSVTAVCTAYDKDKTGFIPQPVFIIMTRKVVPSVSVPIATQLFDNLKDPIKNKISVSVFKAKLLGVLSKFSTPVPSTGLQRGQSGINEILGNYNLARQGSLISSMIETPVNSSRLAGAEESKMSTEERLAARREEVFMKIRKALDYKEDALFERLKSEDKTSRRQLHRSYIVKVFDALNVHLTEEEKDILFAVLEKADDQMYYYYDLFNKIFPHKQLAGESLYTIEDLVRLFTQEMQLKNQRLAELFKEIVVDEKLDHITQASFKKSLMMRGILIPVKKLDEFYGELDIKKANKVDYESFRSVFLKASNIGSPKELQEKVKAQLRVLGKDARTVFEPHKLGTEEKLDFVAFKKALQASQLDLNILQVETLFDLVDLDKSGKLEMEELTKSFNEPAAIVHADYNKDEIRKAIYKNIRKSKWTYEEFFNYYNPTKGKLRLADFTNMMHSIGFQNLKKEEIDAMFKSLDTDFDFQLSPQEFAKFYDQETITVLFPFIFKFKTRIREKVQEERKGIFYIVRAYSEAGESFIKYPEFIKLLEDLKMSAEMSEPDRMLLFQDLDVQKDDKITDAELRLAANGGKTIDVIDLVRRVRDVIQERRVDAKVAFDRCNNTKDDGLMFLKFNELISTFFNITLSLIETEELFLFANLKNNDKLSKAEFLEIFDDFSTKALNPFVLNPKYTAQLTEDSRNFYMKRYRIDSNGSAANLVQVLLEPEQGTNAANSKANPGELNPANLLRPEDNPDYVSKADMTFVTRLFAMMREKGGVTIEDWLAHFDKDKSGSINFEEFERIAKYIGSNLTLEETRSSFMKTKPDLKTGACSRAGFIEYVERVKPLLTDKLFEARLMLPIIDKATRQMMRENEMDIEELFREYSAHKSPVLGLSDFITFIKDCPSEHKYSDKEISDFFLLVDEKKTHAVKAGEYRAMFPGIEAFEKEVKDKFIKDMLERLKVSGDHPRGGSRPTEAGSLWTTSSTATSRRTTSFPRLSSSSSSETMKS